MKDAGYILYQDAHFSTCNFPASKRCASIQRDTISKKCISKLNLSKNHLLRLFCFIAHSSTLAVGIAPHDVEFFEKLFPTDEHDLYVEDV